MDSKDSSLFLTGAQTKNGKDFKIYLSRRMFKDLERLPENRDGTLFGIKTTYRAADALRMDMKAIGADMVGAPVVFHSFRYTFISNLNNSDLPEAVRMKIARHAKLSMNLHYSDFGRDVMKASWKALEEVGV